MASNVFKGDYPSVFPLNDISAADCGFENPPHTSDVLFSYFFLHLSLFDSVCFQ